ncbi:AtzE family amidohydrolase [Acidisoma silvae]|uniref:AtzE family amidohydrolase n=1 Tax=Acidisoma silvae TaxID=2802396 RepID=A0A963YU55_9PROT|nr:AtzE family amidohydrolase [Acidisoma silvae]MCB8876612.1 AtzE family amidohydrolase [Acidisoma silvae]
MSLITQSAVDIAREIKSGAISATEVAQAALARAQALDPKVNAFTKITEARALADAAAVDASIARGEDIGPLAGVPYAVKNLFDIEGITTLAGSKIEADNAPAEADCFAVAQLKAAGGVCIGALNMDEYAYGFTTENTHYGPSRNPHDLARSAGGSSGGSGAAVAAGIVPITLGTDTNGSIRVPASLNGIFGLKPTYGRLSRAGSIAFVPSLDHIGPFARTVADLAIAYDVMQGRDAQDAGQVSRAAEPVTAALDHGIDGLRFGRLGGYFDQPLSDAARSAVGRVSAALKAATVASPEITAAGRSAAFVITGVEGAGQHRAHLRQRRADMEPLSRDRLLAGALIPAEWYQHALKVRALWRAAMAELFRDYDVLIAPATAVPAQPIGQEMLELGGQTMPLRPAFGLFTQPITCIGLPVLAVPLQNAEGKLPIGVQLIAAPWREDLLVRTAAALEAQGLCRAPIAPAFQD